MRSPDVIVVGAGPVGLASAIGARLAGLRVAVVDPRPSPVDKACGEGLMPGALAELSRLGVDPAGHPITGITYRGGGHVAAHTFRGSAGRGVRRTELSRRLHERALELGVQFAESRLVSLDQDDRGVTIALADGSGIRGRWLLGCDGLHSTVRRLSGLEGRARIAAGGAAGGATGLTGGATGRARVAEAGRRRNRGGERRYGLRRHYRVAPWSSRVEVFWSDGFEVYVTPVDDRMIGVAVLGPRGLELQAAIDAIPELSARLHGAEPDDSVAGAGVLRQRVAAHSAGRVLLVGDASGYVDALTGEGMRVGFAQAAAAVRVIAEHDEVRDRAESERRRELGAQSARRGVPRPVEAYERAWRRASGTANRFTFGLLLASTSPVRRMIVPFGARFPTVFGAAVEVIAR